MTSRDLAIRDDVTCAWDISGVLSALAVAGELEARWELDGVTEKEMSHRDERIVSDYDYMLSASKRRDEVVNDVSNKLVEELHVLTDFLDNVAKRRPKGEPQNL